MKKLMVLLTIFVVMFVSFSMQAQVKMTYTMSVDGEGIGEYIENIHSPWIYWGIKFATGNLTRGIADNGGVWAFFAKNTTYRDNEPELVQKLGLINHVTLGVEDWIASEGLSVRYLGRQSTDNHTLDMLLDGNKSRITSNRDDGGGLHIQSAGAHQIYLYDKVYFDDKYWTSLGPGRNDDPTINNANSKMMRIGSKGGIGFWGTTGVDTNDTPQLAVASNQVKSSVPVSIKTDNIDLFLGSTLNDPDGWIGTTSNNGLHIGTNNGSALFITADRNLYVGILHDEVPKISAELRNKYRLFVKKGILSEDYAIAPISSWSDFVFSKNYNLPTISEVATFIQANNHLPDVPSAKQVAEEGYSQHDMNKILLQKIEELTLYTIQQQKEIDSLKAQLQESKK